MLAIGLALARRQDTTEGAAFVAVMVAGACLYFGGACAWHGAASQTARIVGLTTFAAATALTSLVVLLPAELWLIATWRRYVRATGHAAT